MEYRVKAEQELPGAKGLSSALSCILQSREVRSTSIPKPLIPVYQSQLIASLVVFS